jgi:hypothetical protein
MLARDFAIDHVTLQPAWPVPPPSGRVIPVARRRRSSDGTDPVRDCIIDASDRTSHMPPGLHETRAPSGIRDGAALTVTGVYSQRAF